MVPESVSALGGGPMSPRVGLSKRSVLVTGAGGGLGRAVALALAQAGAAVAVSDVPGKALDGTVAELCDAGFTACRLEADLLDVEQAGALPVRTAEALGGLDGLVNCAGVMQTKPMRDLTAEDWRRVVDINLTGVFHVTQAAANYMSSSGGSIVTLASVAARSGRPNAAHYSAAKTALLSLTKSAAMAYAPAVRVNAVCPGIFLTPMWESILADRDSEFGPGAGRAYLDESLEKVPLKRIGAISELANVVAFLLSDLASYVTGQALNVDGGLEMN